MKKFILKHYQKLIDLICFVLGSVLVVNGLLMLYQIPSKLYVQVSPFYRQGRISILLGATLIALGVTIRLWGKD